MAWFESGRNGSVEYRFTLTARNRGGQGVCEGATYAAGPDFTVRLAAVRENQPGGTSYFLLTINASGGFMDRFYSTPVGGPPGSFDHTATVEVVVTYPVRERKDVRVPSGQGTFDWLPPDVELEYALHARPSTNFTIVTTCTDPALQQTVSRPASFINATASLAPHLQIGIGITEEGQNSGASGFAGLCAEVTAVSCTQWGLNFRDSGTPPSGFDHSTANGRCFTTANSIRLELTNPTGILRGSGSDDVWPNMSWGYDGWVRVFADPYPGNPVVSDYLTEADYTATGGHLVQNFLLRRRFNWTTTLKDVGGTLQTLNQSFNQHPAYIKAQLQEAWVNSAGEIYDDRRIPLEDDVGWDAIQLSRQASLVVEPLNSMTGWDYTAGSGVLSVDAGALKVTPADSDCEISKTVNHDLGTYRYLKIDLKADLAETPVRIRLGAYYWDVLIEANDTFETKTLDLAAPHNAASFDEVTALQAITAVGFGDLQLGTIYWFRNMRLERVSADHLHVLPPFRKDEILFHRSDRRPGMVERFRIGSLLRGIQDVVGSINARLDSGFSATAVSSSHAYYNPTAPAGLLEDLMEVTLSAALTLRARVRADRLIPWAGMGDPAQPMPNSTTLTVRFTKRLHGLVDGLVFLRDLFPSGTFTTQMSIRRQGQTVAEPRTDSLRYYRTIPLKAGIYDAVCAVRPTASETYEVPLGSFELINRKMESRPGRARVWDLVTQAGISGAELAAKRVGVCGFGIGEACTGGFYAIAPFYPAPAPPDDLYDVSADAADYSLVLRPDVVLASRDIVDIDFRLRYAAGVYGFVRAESSGSPLPAANVILQQAQEPYTGWGLEEQHNYSAFDLDTSAAQGPSSTVYDFFADGLGYAIGSALDVTVPIPSATHQLTAQVDFALPTAGTILGQVTGVAGAPVTGARILVELQDSLDTLREAITDAAGQYSVDNLHVPGDYGVQLHAAGYNSQATQLSLTGSTPAVVNFQGTLATRIVGTVTSATTGQPIEDATIAAVLLPDQAWAFSAANGAYILQGLPGAGTYSVTAYAFGWLPSSSQAIPVQQGQASVANFVLSPLP